MTDDGRRTAAAGGEGAAARRSSAVGGRSSPAAESGASPFDAMAAGYDEGFTSSLIGRLMREAVWSRLDAAFGPGDRVLELSCGTGEDAVHLGRRGVRVLATDVSEGMLTVARAKVDAAGLRDLVEVARLDLEELGDRGTRSGEWGVGSEKWGDAACSWPVVTSRRSSLPSERSERTPRSSPSEARAVSPLQPERSKGGLLFDGALSNFGGLNCVADQRGVARALAGMLRPGARALLCVMGPLVPWEWGWYLRRGEAQKAVRRLRPGGVAWRGLTIVYPSIGALRAAYAPWFSCRRVSALGALLPPSYAEGWARHHPGLLWALGRVERAFETLPPLPRLADHYLIELERRP